MARDLADRQLRLAAISYMRERGCLPMFADEEPKSTSLSSLQWALLTEFDEATGTVERLKNALKQLHTIALDCVIGGETAATDAAMEEAINALAAAGDPDAISANEEWRREAARLSLSTR